VVAIIKRMFGIKTEANSVIEFQETNLFVAPVQGNLLPLAAVPDEVFSKKMLGDGFAIDPTSGEVVSPISGEVATLFPTKHAIGIIDANGREVLIHFGIDTVHLQGNGFKSLVKQGEKVIAGQKILKVDLELVRGKALSVITPIVFTNLKESQTISLQNNESVKLGQKIDVKITE
jgi:PTS system D-glucosamine-specific IIC component